MLCAKEALVLIEVDAAAKEPLYLQIRNQIVSGIALGQLEPGMQLPSVRALASDLGINLHTVNKAYAVLRDEGYIRMKGRTGAFVAEAVGGDGGRLARAEEQLADQLFQAALAFRASGGARGEFLEAAAAQAARAYGAVPEGEFATNRAKRVSRPAPRRERQGEGSAGAQPAGASS